MIVRRRPQLPGPVHLFGRDRVRVAPAIAQNEASPAVTAIRSEWTISGSAARASPHCRRLRRKRGASRSRALQGRLQPPLRARVAARNSR